MTEHPGQDCTYLPASRYSLARHRNRHDWHQNCIQRCMTDPGQRCTLRLHRAMRGNRRPCHTPFPFSNYHLTGADAAGPLARYALAGFACQHAPSGRLSARFGPLALACQVFWFGCEAYVRMVPSLRLVSAVNKLYSNVRTGKGDQRGHSE